MGKDNKDWKETFKKKLNIEPGVHLGEQAPRDRKKFTFSFWYFFIILLVFMALNTYLVSRQSNVYAVDYNQFKALIDEGTIKRVAIEEEQYIGFPFTRDQATDDLQAYTTNPQNGLEASTYLSSYSTYKVEDPSFIPLLDEKGIEYYATAPEEPSLFSSILSYVLPFVFIILFWRFLFSKMGGQGGQD
ncbi:MAG: ATP-dependent metallopeptidase FtsH/Yme1/Tma family protein, partial [Sphaerochaetaceae bacterium]